MGFKSNILLASLALGSLTACTSPAVDKSSAVELRLFSTDGSFKSYANSSINVALVRSPRPPKNPTPHIIPPAHQPGSIVVAATGHFDGSFTVPKATLQNVCNPGCSVCYWADQDQDAQLDEQEPLWLEDEPLRLDSAGNPAAVELHMDPQKLSAEARQIINTP
jgi:hypothetical protein